jgi:putative membrane protein
VAVSTLARAYDVAGRRRSPTGVAAALPWLLAVATVATQIAYPLVDGESLRRVTIASVVLFFFASVTHALAHHGLRWALTLVVITAGGGLLAEAVGVRTGVPFGDYRYSASLGPQLLDVPVVVPLAWTMMAYPMFVAARRLSRRWAPLIGAVGLAGWDVFLDPQMVADRRWTWTDPSPSLPGITDVPVTNYVGWLAVSVVLMGLLSLTLPRQRASERSETVPALLLFWTYAGSIVGNAFWFGSGSVALAGGIAMGVVVVPYAWVLWQSRP